MRGFDVYEVTIDRKTLAYNAPVPKLYYNHDRTILKARPNHFEIPRKTSKFARRTQVHNEQRAMLEADAQTASWEAARGILERAKAVEVELEHTTGVFDELADQYLYRIKTGSGYSLTSPSPIEPKFAVGTKVSYNYAKWMKDCREYPKSFGKSGAERIVWLYECIVDSHQLVTAEQDLWHAASPTIGWAYILKITRKKGSSSLEGPIPERLVRLPDPMTGKLPEKFWIDSDAPRNKGTDGVYIVPV